jgi:hypothetical protein
LHKTTHKPQNQQIYFQIATNARIEVANATYENATNAKPPTPEGEQFSNNKNYWKKINKVFCFPNFRIF